MFGDWREILCMNWAVKRLIINEEIHMGKKINIEASDEPCMFQFFKKYIHQTDKNEFYCDNRVVDISNPNPGVVVDFKNIDHTYVSDTQGVRCR